MLQERKIDVKPMRFYKEQNMDIESIKQGDLVLAYMAYYYNEVAYMNVSGYNAIMHLDDVNIYESYQKNEKYVISQIGRMMLVRVKEIDRDSETLFLERNSVVKETYQILKDSIGTVVTATIESVMPYGMFADIGNGVYSLLHITEVSKTRCYDLSKIFNKGEEIKVKLIDFDLQSFHFIISRKQAYEKANLKEGMCIKAVCSTTLKDGTGIYVEYDPANIGIMDVPDKMSCDDFNEGTKVQVMISKIVEEGFRCKWFGFV